MYCRLLCIADNHCAHHYSGHWTDYKHGCSWLDEMDPRDRLAPAHYRHINCISADDPIPLGNGATSAVKVMPCSLCVIDEARGKSPVCHTSPVPSDSSSSKSCRKECDNVETQSFDKEMFVGYFDFLAVFPQNLYKNPAT